MGGLQDFLCIKKENWCVQGNGSIRTSMPEIRLTMDYPEDLILIRKIVLSLPKNKKIPNLETIIKIIDKNKKLQKINSQYSHKNRKWL